MLLGAGRCRRSHPRGQRPLCPLASCCPPPAPQPPRRAGRCSPRALSSRRSMRPATGISPLSPQQTPKVSAGLRPLVFPTERLGQARGSGSSRATEAGDACLAPSPAAGLGGVAGGGAGWLRWRRWPLPSGLRSRGGRGSRFLRFSESRNLNCARRPDTAVTSTVTARSSSPRCWRCRFLSVEDSTVCSRSL